MSKEYTTKHAIGDLVYIANVYEVDREVIKAVKIVTLKETVKYGIETKKSTGYWGFSIFGGSDDGYNWYSGSEIFLDKESAIARHENLKAKRDAEDAIEKAKAKADRKQELLDEIKDLDNEE